MEAFDKLVGLMATLRSDEGCPWDRKQKISAFKTFMLEEVYEIIEAIEKEDLPDLREELGDLLFHIVFIAQICKERNAFDIQDVIEDVYRK
ncbi:MAG TPA: MazG nucleotide pyrophosphohydrolase domain-containing protein, partial [Syntrophorhabdaceae bacterium]|nr:MazG nucleotide pyrophosphohydrolase domain-containing protein [Syntrophorhabdaceae bacterium]